MCDDICMQRNMYLDQILAERRSHRRFRPDPCSDDDIRRIIHAGLLAPYAAAAVGTSKDYFRRFFVLREGSPGMKEASVLLMRQVERMAMDLEERMRADPVLRAEAAGFARRLAMIRDLGVVPGAGTAPFLIIAAERRGYPPVQLQSLSHVMENMWLKATALGLGFQMVSVTSEMSGSPEFCALLGIEPGTWDLMGCAAGYAADELSPAIRPPVDDVTAWIG